MARDGDLHLGRSARVSNTTVYVSLPPSSMVSSDSETVTPGSSSSVIDTTTSAAFSPS